MADKLTKKQAGQLGGLATVRKHGTDYMREIGRRGAVTLWKRYGLLPYQVSGWALVHKDTGEVKAVW
jgi:hypothetical protein